MSYDKKRVFTLKVDLEGREMMNIRPTFLEILI